MLSPLQLKRYSLLEISLKEREASPSDVALNWIPGEPDVHADFFSAVEDEFHSRIILTVKSKKTDSVDVTAAWDFIVCLAGVFEFTDRSMPLERVKKLTLVNGSSMLYGMARDILNSISLRGQKPSILLPSLNFAPWAEKDISSTQLAAQKGPAPVAKPEKKAAKTPVAPRKTKS